MKRFSSYVDKKTYETNEKITKLQNKTKELFFDCLSRGENVEYFRKELDKIWGKIDYSFMKKDIEEYEDLIHTYNLEMANYTEEERTEKKQISASYIVALGLIIYQVDKYKNIISKQYDTSINSPGYNMDRTEYIKKKIAQYNSQTVPYYYKNGDIRWVKLSSYTAMIENTNLTRSAWNTTLNDADLLGADKFYIPFHLFSCEYCRQYQNKILTREEVNEYLGIDGEQEGDILHPNCKCSLLIYWGNKINNYNTFTEEQNNEYYHIRQKINALTLKKSELLTDRRIYRKQKDAEDKVDETNKKIRSINSKIKKLQAELPTEEMKKMVVAINR